jgi:hypothetical protein
MKSRSIFLEVRSLQRYMYELVGKGEVCFHCLVQQLLLTTHVQTACSFLAGAPDRILIWGDTNKTIMLLSFHLSLLVTVHKTGTRSIAMHVGAGRYNERATAANPIQFFWEYCTVATANRNRCMLPNKQARGARCEVTAIGNHATPNVVHHRAPHFRYQDAYATTLRNKTIR